MKKLLLDNTKIRKIDTSNMADLVMLSIDQTLISEIDTSALSCLETLDVSNS